MDRSTLKLWLTLTIFVCSILISTVLLIGLPYLMTNRTDEYLSGFVAGSMGVVLVLTLMCLFSIHTVDNG